MWYRAIVLSVDETAKTASVFYIDYGNKDEAVAFCDMRQALICFEYAAQAHKCRTSKYQDPARPGELDQLFELLVNKQCIVRVTSGSLLVPLIDFLEGEVDDIFTRLRLPPPIPATTAKINSARPSVVEEEL